MMRLVQRIRTPRVVLLLLAAWDLLGAAAELLADSALFSLQEPTNGVLAGRAFSGALIIPALVYLYALRNPQRYWQVWWLALVEQVVALASYVYHLGADRFGLEDVILPLTGSSILLVLVVLRLLPQAQPEVDDQGL